MCVCVWKIALGWNKGARDERETLKIKYKTKKIRGNKPIFFQETKREREIEILIFYNL